MCVVILPESTDAKIEIPFVFERVYQRRNGGREVIADILVKNQSDKDLNRLCVLFPDPLVDLGRASKHRDETAAEKEIVALRKNQIQKFVLATDELSVAGHPSNWIYTTLPHVMIDHPNLKSGIFAVERKEQDRGDSHLSGFIKQGWKVSSPAMVSNWTWLLFACNDLAMFQLEAPPEQKIEALAPKERMWLRIKVSVSPSGMNQYPWWVNVFARSREYHWVFRSPGEICKHIRGKIENSTKEEQPLTEAVKTKLGAARRSALQILPRQTNGDDVGDWRSFFYREYGLAVENIHNMAAEPRTPNFTAIYNLPPTADFPKSNRGPYFAFLNRWIKRPRYDKVHEFWFGSDHGLAATDTYLIEISSRVANKTYSLLAWIGLVGFLIAVINLIINLSRLWMP